MYDAILEQPAAFGQVVESAWNQGRQIAERLGQGRPAHIVGTGTSLHAGRIAHYLLRPLLPAGVQTMAAMDFALYPPPLRRDDVAVVISHRGSKHYSVASARQAQTAGAWCALITGQGQSAAAAHADCVVHTVAQERSSAHTVSFVAAVAALSTVASHRQGGWLTRAYLRDSVPPLLAAAVAQDEAARRLAVWHQRRRRIWLAGAGPSGVIAQEIALKIQETSYMDAVGMDLDAMMHGPFQAATSDDLFILICPNGPAAGRLGDVAKAVAAIGAHVLLVGDEPGCRAAGGGLESLRLPEAYEPFSALACAVVLQLFTHHLAVGRGANPDGFHLEQPTFAAAARCLRL